MSDGSFWLAALERIELLPVAVIVAILANSSGFSGAILFQPIIYFTQGLPLATSIATGIASETIGMSSGAARYHLMHRIAWSEVRPSLPWVLGGVIAGYTVFRSVSALLLKGILAGVLIVVAVLKLLEVIRPLAGTRRTGGAWWRAAVGMAGGVGSASTGTGVCELHQPFFERLRHQPVIAANAAAIATEAWGNLWISAFNLNWGMIDFTVLVWTGSGVLVGAQLGALAARWIPVTLMKVVFAIGVLLIGLFYLYQVFAV